MQVRLYLQSGMRRLVDEELRAESRRRARSLLAHGAIHAGGRHRSSPPRPHGLALGEHGDEGALQLGGGRPALRRRGAAASPLRGSGGGGSRHVLGHLGRGPGRPRPPRRGDHPERRRSRGVPLPRHRRSRAGPDLLREPRLLPQHCARGVRRHRGAAAGPAARAGRDRRGSWARGPQRQYGSWALSTASRWPATCPTWRSSSSGRPSRSCPCSRDRGSRTRCWRPSRGDCRWSPTPSACRASKERRPGGSISPPRAPARSPPRPRGCSRIPAERGRLATSGRALVEARYSWERQVEALLALYGSTA